MNVTPLLLALVAVQAQDNAVYKDGHLGLQFEHPKSWKVRRDKVSAVFEFTVDGGQKATLQLFSAKYKDTADMYQMIQAEINRSMKRKVERQWQEEFLGVPMLLTKISYDEGGHPMSAVTGLLYTAYEDKMNFRLSVPAEASEKAEAQWHDVLLTLRTTSGDLPTTEDPTRPAVKPEPPKSTNIWTPPNKTVKIERGEIPVTFTTGDKSYKLSLPKGWSIDGSQLKHDGLHGSMTVTVEMGVPEDAANKLMESATSALSEFDVVSLREDPKPLLARSGAVVGKVVRSGTAKGQTLTLGQIVGSCEGVYWLVTYRSAEPGAYKKDKDAINSFCSLFFAERA